MSDGELLLGQLFHGRGLQGVRVANALELLWLLRTDATSLTWIECIAGEEFRNALIPESAALIQREKIRWATA